MLTNFNYTPPFYFTTSPNAYFTIEPFESSILLCRRCSDIKRKLQITQEVNVHVNPTLNQVKTEESQLLNPYSQRNKTEEPIESPSLQNKKFKGRIDVRGKSLKKISTPEQKEGRNSNSNLFRMFIRRIRSSLINSTVLNSIIEKHKLCINSQKFKQWFESLDIDITKYIRVPLIKHLFIGRGEWRQHTKIMRILLHDFLQKQALNCYLTSKKARRGIMKYNLISIRTILKIIFKKKDNELL